LNIKRSRPEPVAQSIFFSFNRYSAIRIYSAPALNAGCPGIAKQPCQDHRSGSEKSGYKVFGKFITIGTKEDPYAVIPKFWEDFQKDGTYLKICRTAGFEPYSGVLLSGAHYDYPQDGSYLCKYMIFTLLPDGLRIPPEFEILAIPEAKWVVFSGSFKKVEDSAGVMQDIWKRIFSEWFSSSEYKPADGPQLEVYPDNWHGEVWIPVVKK
jgi:AraC family transcriptional regulator